MLNAVPNMTSALRTPPLSPSRHLAKDNARRDSEGKGTETNDMAAVVASLEAQWAKKKAQWMAHFRSSVGVDDSAVEDEPAQAKTPTTPDNCHVCNASLGILKRHRCRNCGLAVCGVHSKNQVPLPHLGIMKEARVCDICTRQLVQRRAGYRSPRPNKPRGSTSGDELLVMVNELTPPTSPLEMPREPALASPRKSSGRKLMTGMLPSSSSSKEMRLPDSNSGVLYSCLLEEQANIVDEILYLGTFTMGGRALASRHMNGNVAIWNDRWFMLTSAEMLTFKATDSDDKNGSGGPVAALGELRSSVHLTDILHIEVNEQYPRNLTVIRSDGRVFRVRARTPEQCQEIAAALRKAQQLFQDAMHKLQRGVRLEDYTVSCMTIQHESSLVEHVVASSPLLMEKIRVEMYPSSILRFYVNGPEANGVAQYSCQMLVSALREEDSILGSSQTIESDADPLRSSPSDSRALRVSLRPSRVSASYEEANEHKARAFWSSMAALIGIGTYLNMKQWTFLEVVVWLIVIISWLTRYHDPLLLLLTTRRLHRARRLCIEVVDITYGRKHGKDNEYGDSQDQEIEVDPRFIEGCNGDVEEAKTRYKQTLQWRREEEVDSILLKPLPQFASMKASYVHFAHKKDKQGHLLSVDHFGYMKKMREVFLSRGVTEAQAVRHQIFLQEFYWNVIDPRPFPNGNTLKIFDMKGISMGDVSGDVFTFMKTLGVTIAEYNPERIFQVFIVNPPSWFNLIWKLVSPSINPKTRERIHVVRGQKEIAKALLEFVDEEDLPVEYGGKCTCPGGCFTNSPEERDLCDFVENHLNAMEEGDPRIQEALDALKAKYQQQLEKYPASSATDASH